jgi:hypothetical protein
LHHYRIRVIIVASCHGCFVAACCCVSIDWATNSNTDSSEMNCILSVYCAFYCVALVYVTLYRNLITLIKSKECVQKIKIFAFRNMGLACHVLIEFTG